MAGSRNFSIRTPLQKVSQTTDGTRPPGLTAAVPVRLYRDFVGKSAATFRTNPTSASVVRSRNHNGLQSFFFQSWAAIFGQEEYGGYNPAAIDTASGEFSGPQYTAASVIDGSFVTADSRLIADVAAITDTETFVVDAKLSGDGRFTYLLNASNSSGVPSLYINIIDNLTGVQKNPTQNSVSFPGGKINLSSVITGPLVAVDGNIAVVDDSTSQDASNHMAFNSALFVAHVVGLSGGTYTSAIVVYRYDFGANNVDVLDAGHALITATPTYTPRAFANIQLVVQASGTMQAMVIYRSTFTAGPDRGTVQLGSFSSFISGAAPANSGVDISGSPTIDFTAPPHTAVSRRGEISANRRMYFYNFVSGGSSSFSWLVLNPSTFFSGGAPSQSVVSTAFAPSGTTYIGMKAAPIQSTFVHSGDPCMAVGFIIKNTTSNTTQIQAFIHTTSTTTDIATTSPIVVATNTGIQATFEIGVGVFADPSTDQARFAIAYNSPSGATVYAFSEVRCTDETNLNAIVATTSIVALGVLNTTLNTLPSIAANRFAFAMAMWNDTAGAFAKTKNDVQVITYLNGAQTTINVRVVVPFIAIGLAWDAELYENFPNPIDANFNPRVTNFYARATGCNDAAYTSGALVAGFRTTPGYNPSGDGSNVTDLTSSFVLTTASADNFTHASLETAPTIVYPLNGSVDNFTATMVDEFTFTSITWGAGAQLPGQIQVGMSLVLTLPAFATGRYTISAVTYDSIAEAITSFSVSQPIPFLSTAAATYTGYIAIGPSYGIRQLVLPASANGGNNRQGNVIFPSVVELDYVNIESLATNSEICELTVNTQFGVPPISVNITIRGYNLNDSTIPTNQAAGIEVSVSLDAGTTWLTKVLSVQGTSTISGATNATSFGVQSFIGSTWVSTVPAGINEGDFLFIETGPNEGVYAISGVTSDSAVGPRVFVDRSFPVPGNSTVVSYVICSAKDDYQDDGLGGPGYGIMGMKFNVSSLPYTTDVMHVRVECKDQVVGHNPTYEFDSITAQWEP